MSRRPVVITAAACLYGEAALAFDPRRALPERKHVRLMSPAVRVGVGAVLAALERRPGWTDIPPERRGLFVGARPEGAMEELIPALDAARAAGGTDAATFGRVGYPAVPPLWLVAGLSNNIVGYASAYADLRGPVSNRCEGRIGGLAAIVEAWHAVAEGRVDLAVAGGADDVRVPPPWARPGALAAAFVVLEAGGGGPIVVAGGVERADVEDALDDAPDRGAAHGALRLVRALAAGGDGEVGVADAAVGARCWIRWRAGAPAAPA